MFLARTHSALPSNDAGSVGRESVDMQALGIPAQFFTYENTRHEINDSDLRIGCAVGHPGYTFRNGSIDEVGVWRRALSQAEIEEAMKGFLAVLPKDKVAAIWGDIKRWAIIYR